MTDTLGWRLGTSVTRHAAAAIGVALVVATLAFIGTQSLRGDIAMRVAEARYGDAITFALADDIRRHAGLDQGVLAQYVRWIGSIAAGNLGRSIVSNRPVVEELGRGLAPTLTVIGLAVPLAVILSGAIGFLAGVNKGGPVDRLMLVVAAFLSSIPAFLTGALLVTVFAIKLQWFPVAGTNLSLYFVLPALTLAIALVPDLSRITRNAVVRTLRDFYVTYGRVKGQSWLRIVFVHALRPTLVPVVAYLGPLVAHMVGGMIIVDVLFNLGGLGSILVESVLASDIPLALGAGLLIGVSVVVINGLTDVAVKVLDPRDSLSGSPR
ncbi:ABC transporter permease [Bradyrhizobium sp. USDA 10063]